MDQSYEIALPASTGIVLTKPEAEQIGLRSKHHQFRTGREQGGNRLSGGQIHKILLNPVYLGQIRHKDQLWPGKHPAIIDQDLWDRVQQKLQQVARRSRGRTPAAVDHPSLLGKLVDDTGDRLTPTHCTKTGRRHRYYISNRLISGGTDPTGWRLPARALETSVTSLIVDHLASAASDHRLLATPDLRDDVALQRAAEDLVQTLRSPEPDLLRAFLVSGTVTPKYVQLSLNKDVLARHLGVPANKIHPDLCDVCAPLQLRRRGVETKLVVGEAKLMPDPTLAKALRASHHCAIALRDGTPLKVIAAAANCTGAYIRKRGQLAFLSPKIQLAIRDGTLPVDVTLERILRQQIPLDLTHQERMFRV